MGKAFIAFDTLFSIIPILLIIIYTFTYANQLQKSYLESLEQTKLENKLVSIANLVVTNLAAKKSLEQEHDANYIQPNWIVEEELTKVDRENLRKTLNLAQLYIDWEPEGKNCIYRLVVFGEQKETRQLFVCGE